MTPISVVVVTYNSKDHIYGFIESLKRHSPSNTELVIVDNSNQDYGLSFVKKFNDGSYPFGLNEGIKLATHPIVVCCNPDIRFEDLWVQRLQLALDVGYGIACPVSNNVSGIQGFDMPKQIRRIEAKMFIGFCFMLSKKTYEAIGPFDEQFVYEQDDLDYSIRANQKDVRIGIVNDCFIHHFSGASAATDATAKNEKRWLSLVRMFYKYPELDFNFVLGASWPKDWLLKVAEIHPKIKLIPSYMKLVKDNANT